MHVQYRSWCKFCVMKRGVNSPHKGSDARWFREKELHFLGLRTEQQNSLISLGTTVFHSDATSNQLLKRRRGNLHKIAKRKPDCARKDTPVGESQSNGVFERAVGLMAGQARTLKAALEHRICVRAPLDAGVRCVFDEQMRHRPRRKDTDTHTAWTKGQHAESGIWCEDVVHACQNSKKRKVGSTILSWIVRSNAELVVRGSGCHRARTGDQDTLGERQGNPRVGKMGRGSNTRNASSPVVSRRQ